MRKIYRAMNTILWILLVFVVWLILSFPIAIFIGEFISAGNPEPDDEEDHPPQDWPRR